MNELFSYSRIYVATACVATLGIGVLFRIVTYSGHYWLLDLLTVLHLGVVSLILGALTILVIDLVFGTRPFWQRFAEGWAWIGGVVAGLKVVLLTFSNVTELPSNLTLALILPAIWLAIQLPFWFFAYGTQWQLSAIGSSEVPRVHWRLRDWFIGCIIFSVTLAMARPAMADDSTDVLFIPVICFFGTLVSPFVCMLYVLKSQSWRFTLISLGVHLTPIAAGGLIALMSFGGKSAKWDILLIALLLGTFHLLGPFAGTLSLRLGGYGLVWNRTTHVVNLSK